MDLKQQQKPMVSVGLFAHNTWKIKLTLIIKLPIVETNYTKHTYTNHSPHTRMFEGHILSYPISLLFKIKFKFVK